MDIKLAVKVIAIGFPALLIVLGWVSYMSGSGLEAISEAIGKEGIKAGSDLKRFGIGLIIVGIFTYAIELAVYLIYAYYEV